jgi:hypothetical protein
MLQTYYTLGMFGCFCPACLMCSNAKEMGQNMGLYVLLGICFPIGGIYLLRAKARENYGIEVQKNYTY